MMGSADAGKILIQLQKFYSSEEHTEVTRPSLLLTNENWGPETQSFDQGHITKKQQNQA